MMQTEEKVKTTATGGRKHANFVKFFLNDEEYEKLCKDAASVNKDLSKYLRFLIHWIIPITPPSVEVKEFTRELSHTTKAFSIGKSAFFHALDRAFLSKKRLTSRIYQN